MIEETIVKVNVIEEPIIKTQVVEEETVTTKVQITSVTNESDPVFVQSPAHKITSADVENIKNNFATKEYVEEEIASFDFIKIVDALPEKGLANRIYLVPKEDGDTQDLFDEYIWANKSWEFITTKQIEVELTEYARKKDLDELQEQIEVDLTGCAKKENLDELQEQVDNAFNGNETMGSIVVENVTCKNMFDYNSSEYGFYGADGTNNTGDVASHVNRISDYIVVDSDKEYTASANQELGYFMINEFDENKNWLKRTNLNNVSTNTITTSSTTKYIRVSVNIDNAVDMTISKLAEIEAQIEKGSIATEYIPCKKFGYDNDEIVVISSEKPTNSLIWLQKGKNLFNKNKTPIVDKFIDGSTGTIKPYNGGTKMFILEVQPNKPYTVSKIQGGHFRVGFSSVYPNEGVTLDSYIYNNNVPAITIMTASTTKYLCCSYWQTGVDTLDAESMKKSIQVEQGSIATEYEDYINRKIYVKDSNGEYEEFANLE